MRRGYVDELSHLGLSLYRTPKRRSFHLLGSSCQRAGGLLGLFRFGVRRCLKSRITIGVRQPSRDRWRAAPPAAAPQAWLARRSQNPLTGGACIGRRIAG